MTITDTPNLKNVSDSSITEEKQPERQLPAEERNTPVAVIQDTPPNTPVTDSQLHRHQSTRKTARKFDCTSFYLFLLITGHVLPQPSDLIMEGQRRTPIMYSSHPANFYESFSETAATPNPNYLQYGMPDGEILKSDGVQHKEFFNSRLRWRNDAELASYAWHNQQKNQYPVQLNMMLAERPVQTYAFSPQERVMMDYDNMNNAWRRSVGHGEKSMLPAPGMHAVCGGSNALNARSCSQDVRAMQQKSYSAAQSLHDDSDRYEQISKSYFADFYQSVLPPPASEFEPCSSSAYNCSKPDTDYASDAFVEEPVVFDENQVPTDFPASVQSVEDPLAELPGERDPVAPEATLQINEDEYLAYVTDVQVLNDISSAVVEQSHEVFDNVIDQVARTHESGDIDTFTPFDAPLPAFFENLDDELFESNSENKTPEKSLVPSSPSSGFFSGDSRSSSPVDDASNESRFYGKLAPQNKENDFGTIADDSNKEDYNRCSRKSSKSSLEASRRRGRHSRDNELVQRHNLPANAEELANMSHKTLQRVLKDPSLSDVQRALIKKIRRRGRNKEAARKCRQRRGVPNSPSPHSPLILYPPSRR